MTRKVLLVASGGGHWIQLLRVAPAFDGMERVYITTSGSRRLPPAEGRCYRVNDANRWERWNVARLVPMVLRILLRERPELILTTGAAVGCIAVVLGRMLGTRTIWLDSMANVEELSLSGRLARPFASLFLTQHPELANRLGLEFAGRVF